MSTCGFAGKTYEIQTKWPTINGVVLQITCVNVRSYGIVTMPSCLPASLESLQIVTKARGRSLGPSLLMPKANNLPSLKVSFQQDTLCVAGHVRMHRV